LASAIAVAALAGCGGSSRPPNVSAALREQLEARDLSVRSVTCVEASERIGSARVHRCNVDFGDPHVQIYCAAFVDGRLRALEWRQAVRGALDRPAAARDCAGRLRTAR
jgi:hypothetical protein